MRLKKSYNRYIALIILIILTLLLGYALFPYVNAFFGALILFVLFRPLHRLFIKKLKLNKKLSAVIIIILTFIIVLIPTYIILSKIIVEMSEIVQDQTVINNAISFINRFYPNFDLNELISSQVSQISEFVKNLVIQAFRGFGNMAITLIILYFVFYYLLINEKTIEKRLHMLIPFKKKHREELMVEFENVTYSTVISTGLIAVLQGVLLAVGFLFFNIKGAFFWGFIGAILSFFPVVGTPLVWGPAVIVLFIQDNIFGAVGLLVWGLILSNVDNFLRPVLQKKIGKLHPLTSLLGIFIGVPLFGILGIVIGPLLLSYFLLIVRMFREEYV